MGVHLDHAFMLMGQGRGDLAEAELRKELAVDPNSAEAHSLLAICLAQRDRLDEATAEADQGIHLSPELAIAHYTRAAILHDRNWLEDADVSLDEAMRLDPLNPDCYSLRGSIRYKQGKWQAALQAAEEGLRIDPEHIQSNNVRAMALVKLGRRAEAGATFASALARNPENAVTHANQGWALLDESNPTKALEHFREALRLEPNLDWARAGIVEALKARNVIYRLFLMYFFWMSKLSPGVQFGILIGLYFLQRALSSLARNDPDLGPWVWPIIGVYIAFAVMTWIADPLFNLVLRLSRFGRLALSREQIVASNWIGSCILLALLAVVGWLVFSSIALGLAALVLGLLIIPLSGTFKCEPGWPRTTMALVTAAMAVVGGLTVYFVFVNSPYAETTVVLFVIGSFLSPWIANGLVMALPRR